MNIIRKMMPKSLDGISYSSKTQTNKYIVIHNTAGRIYENVATAARTVQYFHTNEEGANTSTHYVIDDKEIYQILENNWKGHHVGGNNASGYINGNTIGIEVADGPNVNHEQAVKNVIELTRYLMKELNIPVENVITHKDCSGKDCPYTILRMTIDGKNGWEYIKEQLKLRNEQDSPIDVTPTPGNPSDPNIGTTPNNTSSTGGTSTDLDVLPNVDHRYNIANMDEVKGACLIFLPPYNVCDKAEKEKHFEKWGWDRKYHYIIDHSYNVDKADESDDEPIINECTAATGTGTGTGTGSSSSGESTENNENGVMPIPEDPDSGTNPDSGTDQSPVENTTSEAIEDNCIEIKGGFEKVENRLLQCYGMADVDKVTYISRSLFNSHPEKHNIMIACFIPSYKDLVASNITYEQIEKNIINSVSKILWANGLEAKDLWREFDLNRMPSPAIYLDRDKWKDLLAEIDKLVEWRNKKFGKVTTTYEKYLPIIVKNDYGTGSSGGGSGSGGSSGGGSGPNIGDIGNVEQAVWTFLTGAGYSTQMAAGIMGNMYQESGVNPTRIQGNGKGPAAGICQWENYNTKSARWKQLDDYAKSKGKEWTDLQSQLEFMHMELQGTAPDKYTNSLIKSKYGGWESFSKINDIIKATDAFEICFERAGKPMMENRYAAAKKYYNKFLSGSSIVSISKEPEIVFVKTTPRVTTKAISGSLSWPCPSCKSISSKFGPRKAPTAGASSNHKGIDIPCSSGSNIIAAAAGKVTTVSYHNARGHYIKIDHGNGLGTLYQHLTRATKSVGESVNANEVIAISGSSGVGTGPHLHFEVHENGTPVNPENYVSPGTANGSISGDTSGGGNGSNGGNGGNGGTAGDLLSTGSGGTNVDPDTLVNSIHDDVINPGPAANLPYNGNSMGGLEHDDFGGRMIYAVEDPVNKNEKKPIIESVLTSNDYMEFCEKFFMGERLTEEGKVDYVLDFKKYWEFIDVIAAKHEPYDKGLVDTTEIEISNNDRLNTLSTNFITNNENTFHFNVVDSGPGSPDTHCVKSADELNIIARPKDLKVEPVYPDLIVPPHYSTTDYDESSPNTIPLSMLENTELDNPEMNKQYAFDYNLLTGKKKETNPCSGPINFLDPYPIDDKVQELENHFPKVFIDEIESQIYSCNHPGCPIAQPMAKNFAMLQDAIMNQSKRVEQRLCKLENILAAVIRNQGRLGARMNINCVYYGGQSVYGKYKCIRCLHDDRIHDGAIVTLDQCLNCTRYEPILGQVYQILDDTGLNASIILDDMQMSYSDLYAVQQLNMGTLRSPKYDYVENSGDKNCLKPKQTRQEIWKEANKEAFLKKKEDESKLKEETTETIIEGDTPTTNVELTEEELRQILNTQDETLTEDELRDMLSKTPTNDMSVGDKTVSVDDNGNVKVKKVENVSNIKETDYLFRMDWNETFFNQQEADVKSYPAEGIIARYKKQDPDLDYETYLLSLDPELDKEVIEDVQKEMSLLGNQWVDTREEAETVQVNKYSSENFYFEGFGEFKYAVGGSGGSNYSNVGATGPGSAIGAECRAKIVEMAKKIVGDYDAGKAKYCQSPRTVDYTKPKSSGGKVCYDCTSMVSCCYLHAGLNSMYDKSCRGGSLVAEIVKNGGKMWLLNDAGLQEAKPGDVLLKANSAVSQSQMGSQISTSHAMVYIGGGQIAHASSPSGGIRIDDLKSSFRWKDGKHFFVRPKDLIEADAKAATTASGGGINTQTGTIDGKSYVAKISGAVCTSYFSGSGSASGLGLENGKTCASHNIPYGTKIYFPSLKNKLGDGIVTVTDTGGPLFDFDIYTNAGIGKINADAYVLSWGSGKIAASYTEMIDFYTDTQWNNLKSAWNKYKSMNGKLMSFLHYSQKDANIKNHPRY